MLPTNMICKEYNKEWYNQIIDALYITTGRMSYRPNVEDSFKELWQRETK